jgi:hypothetical protein
VALKRKRLLLIAVPTLTVLAVVSALLINQAIISSHMYPQDSIHNSSNLSVKGIVTSIEKHYKGQGLAMDNYHIFRLYIRLNITEIVWVKEDLTDWIPISNENNTVNGWNNISIGYDNLDEPRLSVGQTIECKGYYVPVTDSPYSFKITISPSISESYLKH